MQAWCRGVSPRSLWRFHLQIQYFRYKDALGPKNCVKIKVIGIHSSAVTGINQVDEHSLLFRSPCWLFPVTFCPSGCLDMASKGLGRWLLFPQILLFVFSEEVWCLSFSHQEPCLITWPVEDDKVTLEMHWPAPLALSNTHHLVPWTSIFPIYRCAFCLILLMSSSLCHYA